MRLGPAETRAAEEANRQRVRLDARAKLIPRRAPGTSTREGIAYSGPSERIVIVIGGKGAFRKLADELGPLIGDAVTEGAEPAATVEAIKIAAAGAFPRVVILAPIGLSGPIVEEIIVRNRRWGLGWPFPVDLLAGLRVTDRDAFLRLAIRVAKGVT